MISKMWYYENGIDKEPVPVLIIKEWSFNNFSVVHYRRIENGKLLPVEETTNSFGEKSKFGLNDKKFPDINTKYCSCCGEIYKGK